MIQQPITDKTPTDPAAFPDAALLGFLPAGSTARLDQHALDQALVREKLPALPTHNQVAGMIRDLKRVDKYFRSVCALAPIRPAGFGQRAFCI